MSFIYILPCAINAVPIRYTVGKFHLVLSSSRSHSPTKAWENPQICWSGGKSSISISENVSSSSERPSGTLKMANSPFPAGHAVYLTDNSSWDTASLQLGLSSVLPGSRLKGKGLADSECVETGVSLRKPQISVAWFLWLGLVRVVKRHRAAFLL